MIKCEFSVRTVKYISKNLQFGFYSNLNYCSIYEMLRVGSHIFFWNSQIYCKCRIWVEMIEQVLKIVYLGIYSNLDYFSVYEMMRFGSRRTFSYIQILNLSWNVDYYFTFNIELELLCKMFNLKIRVFFFP